jgi:AcrR family transcriptional regulator
VSQPVKRRYDSSGRRAAAARRRAAIVEAATRLFLTAGYPATTMAAIAAEAGVTTETVYTVVGTKPELFRLLTETAISGTDEPVPVLQRDYIAALRAEPTGRGKLEIYAAAMTRIQQRMAPLYRMVQQAAAVEPALGEVWQQLLDRRARNMPLLIEHLEDAGVLRGGLARRQAADTVWAVNSTEVYQLMTETRGWTAEQYQRWLASTLIRLLLADDGQQD